MLDSMKYDSSNQIDLGFFGDYGLASMIMKEGADNSSLKPVLKDYDFELSGSTHEWDEQGSSGHVVRAKAAGGWTSERLRLDITLRRESSYWVLYQLVPIFLLVIAAWCTFFINRAQAPARVALSLVTFLALNNRISGMQSQLPKTGRQGEHTRLARAAILSSEAWPEG